MTTLAIASALPALFAAATLSLTKPSDYCYVNITATNSLEGTGIGATAPADGEDAPLRYEDIAFLAEAYAERVAIFDKKSYGDGSRTTVATNIYANPASISNDHAKCFKYGGLSPTDSYNTRTIFGYYAPVFLDPAHEPISEARVANRGGLPDRYNGSQVGLAWCDIFNTDTPFAAATNLATTAFIRDASLSAAPVAALYADLAKLSRPAVYVDGFRSTDPDASLLDQTYHYVKKTYASDSVPTTTTEDTTDVTSNPHLPSATLYLYASKTKTRSFTMTDGDYDTIKAGEVKSSESYVERSNTYFAGQSEVYINLYPAFQPLSLAPTLSQNLRRATAVKAFALAKATYYTRQSPMSTTYTEHTHRFVMPFTVKFVGGNEMPFLLYCNAGGESFAKGLLDTARSLFSDAPTAASGGALLGDIETPEDPSANAPYDDMIKSGELVRKNTNATEAEITVSITDILVYFDMEFHSKATEPTE